MTPKSDFTRHLGRIYLTFTGAFVIFLASMAMLSALGVENQIIGWFFIGFTILIYAAIGAMTRSDRLKDYYIAGGEVPAVYNGMATAADWMSAASFIGMAGTIYALGYDGLAYVVGWTGGYVLIGVLIAPYMRKFGAYTVPDFLGQRYGGIAPRALGVLVLLLCSFAYIVAQLIGTGIIVSRFLDISYEWAVFAGLVGLLFCSLMGGMRAVTWTQVAQYIILIVAFLVPVVLLSIKQTGWPFPFFSYGETLQEIQTIEQNNSGGFFIREISSMLPFSHLDQINFAALILCLMLGTAALPHVLIRFFTTRSVRGARQSVAWALFFILALYLTAPAYAAFSRYELYQTIVGQNIAALPDWIFDYGRQGLIKICGVEAVNLHVVEQACGAGRLLSAHLIWIEPDALVIATPEIAGMPYLLAALVAAGGLAAALSTAEGLLIAISGSISHDLYAKILRRGQSERHQLNVARLVLLGVALIAAFVAVQRPTNILGMVSWAFSIAAAGLFPAILFGLWWKRASKIACAFAMLSGAGVTVFYLIVSHYFPQFGVDYAFMQPFAGEVAADQVGWFGIRNISAGIFGVPVGIGVLFVLSWITPAPSEDMQEKICTLSYPCDPDKIHKPEADQTALEAKGVAAQSAE